MPHKHLVHRYLKAIFLCVMVMFVTSCLSPPMYQHTKDRIDNSRDNLDDINQKAFQSAPTTVTKSGAYIDTKPISLDQPPAWLDQPITVHGTQLPFDFFVNRILSQTGAFVHYGSGITRDKKISMNYKGTVRGALEDLQVTSDYAYDTHGNTVSWSALKTKTFNIAFYRANLLFKSVVIAVLQAHQAAAVVQCSNQPPRVLIPVDNIAA